MLLNIIPIRYLLAMLSKSVAAGTETEGKSLFFRTEIRQEALSVEVHKTYCFTEVPLVQSLMMHHTLISTSARCFYNVLHDKYSEDINKT